MNSLKKVLFSITILSLLFIASVSHSQSVEIIDYGSNDSAGSYIEVNGINLYFEVYGSGEPLLIIHGGSSSIAVMNNQISYFSKKFRVIAPDSRGHGKSELGEGQLSYEQMSEDMFLLLDALSIQQTNVLGWSDGAIVGLVMGTKHSERINKMALMAPNIRPLTAPGVNRPEVTELDEERRRDIEEKISQNDQSQNWKFQKMLMDMWQTQPNISNDELQRISSPVLLMAGDRDLSTNVHSVEIFENLPNAHLAILPGETHFTPMTNPELFNSLVDNFFQSEFIRPDSIEIIKSF